ncbi:unnamed protein product [Pleuronectes platessa]|uniref:Uncharacterized protein n=1 Tax=Pleuronectes platessa TaxID=8262 RepID=A0A9N7YQ34_PLEPL|nr:unnamed protein product [Pleuronectes platessa]
MGRCVREQEPVEAALRAQFPSESFIPPRATPWTDVVVSGTVTDIYRCVAEIRKKAELRRVVCVIQLCEALRPQMHRRSFVNFFKTPALGFISARPRIATAWWLKNTGISVKCSLESGTRPGRQQEEEKKECEPLTNVLIVTRVNY